MRSGLKMVRLFALVVWVGGLIFFAFVVAPVAFGVLPSPREAGLVVGASLRMLHRMGLIAGCIYLIASAAGTRLGRWWIGPSLVSLMMVLTAMSQWSILPRMEVDRTAAGGDVAEAAVEDPARMGFERLHRLSERVEGGVLLLGIGATTLLAIDRNSSGTKSRI